MQLCFLFGSGISAPADYPTVSAITEKVLCGNKPAPTGTAIPQESPPTEIVAFMRWLKMIADARFCVDCGHVTNYEDIFFLAGQIHDDLLNEYENPALAPLIEKAILEFWVRSENQSAGGRDRVADLATGVMRYIRRSVELELEAGEKQRRTDHLNFIREAINDVGIPDVCLLTVNHDTLLETFLCDAKIGFTDGFADEDKQIHIRKWKPSLLSKMNARIRVLKLHGGVNWIRFCPRKAKPWKNRAANMWKEEYVGIRSPQYDPNIKDEHERNHEPCVESEKATFLIGTFNKLSSYTDPVLLELYYGAFRALESADALVVVGYGFGDKGVNKLMADWLCSPKKRCIVIVDRSSESEVRERSRGAIKSKWEDKEIGKRFGFIQRDLKEKKKDKKLSWQVIRKQIEVCQNTI